MPHGVEPGGVVKVSSTKFGPTSCGVNSRVCSAVSSCWREIVVAVSLVAGDVSATVSATVCGVVAAIVVSPRVVAGAFVVAGTVVFAVAAVPAVVVAGVVAPDVVLAIDLLLELQALRATSEVAASRRAVRGVRFRLIHPSDQVVPRRRHRTAYSTSLFHQHPRAHTRVHSDGVTTAQERFAHDWPLIGREAIVDRFRSLLVAHRHAAADVDAGLAIVGDVGVGKTRLATACVDIAEGHGWRTARIIGSRAASSIPFGAAASMLRAHAPDEIDTATIIRRVYESMSHGEPLCLMVDNADLLDNASLTLVQHLIASSNVVVVIASNIYSSGSNAGTPLWRDTRLTRVDLVGLGRAEHDAFVRTALDGPVDETTAARLFAESGGNPLFTRELLMAAVDDNALFADGRGGWRLGRMPRSSSRLGELVSGRIGTLNDVERRCLETIAIAEPIGIEVLELLGLTDALNRLERRRLIQAVTTGERVEVVVAHPLYAETARQRLLPLRARNLRRRLADALEALRGSARDVDLRIATWRLEAGVGQSAASLSAAANEAMAMGDVIAAERFASAAHDADPSPETAMLLAGFRFRAGDGEVTEALLADAALEALDDTLRVRCVALRAKNLFWNLGKDADAFALLNDAVVGEVDNLLQVVSGELRLVSGSEATTADLPDIQALGALRAGRYSEALAILRSGVDEMNAGGLESFVLVEGAGPPRARRLPADYSNGTVVDRGPAPDGRCWRWALNALRTVTVVRPSITFGRHPPCLSIRRTCCRSRCALPGLPSPPSCWAKAMRRGASSSGRRNLQPVASSHGRPTVQLLLSGSLGVIGPGP